MGDGLVRHRQGGANLLLRHPHNVVQRKKLSVSLRDLLERLPERLVQLFALSGSAWFRFVSGHPVDLPVFDSHVPALIGPQQFQASTRHDTEDPTARAPSPGIALGRLLPEAKHAFLDGILRESVVPRDVQSEVVGGLAVATVEGLEGLTVCLRRHGP
jgi:hypothetical protein